MSGAGHFKTLCGQNVLYSGKTGHENHGVAIWVNENLIMQSFIISNLEGPALTAQYI